MKTFKEYVLNERFVNLFLKDVEKREEMADEVWDILQNSYSKIGGFRGAKDADELVKTFPMWKVATIDGGRPVAVALYKDKSGRKLVAMGTKKVAGAKAKILDMILSGLKTNRSWYEISGKPWDMLVNSLPKEVLLSVVLPVKQVQKLLPSKDITPAFGKDRNIKASDPFKDFWYVRSIRSAGPEPKTKIALGTPGKGIT